MAVVDFIDLGDDDEMIKVDYVDLTIGEDNDEEENYDDPPQPNIAAESAASSSTRKNGAAVPVSETTSLPMLTQDQGATTSLTMTDQGTTCISSLAEEAIRPENQKFLVAGIVAKKGMQSGNQELIAGSECADETVQSKYAGKGVISSSMTEHGAIRSSLMAEETMQPSKEFLAAGKEPIQSTNQEFIANCDCTDEPKQFDNTVEALVFSSMIGQGSTCNVGQLRQMTRCPHILPDGFPLCIPCGAGHPHGEPCSRTVPCNKTEASVKYKGHIESRVMGNAGNAMGRRGTYSDDAHEQPEGDIEAAMGAFSPVDIDDDDDDDAAAADDDDGEVMMHLPASPIASREASVMASFPIIANKDVISLPPQDKEKEINAVECNKQLRVVHTDGLLPTLHDAHSGFSVMGYVGSSTGSTGICNVDSEIMMFQCRGSNKRPHRNAMHCNAQSGRWRRRCKFEGCEKTPQGRKFYCVKHRFRYNKCKFEGCSKFSQGNTDFCVAHGGGKRCKFEGCGKRAPGPSGFCIEHGGDRYRMCKYDDCVKYRIGKTGFCSAHGKAKRCMFEGCMASAARSINFCSLHRESLLTLNNSTYETLPATLPKCWEKKGKRCKRISCSVIGERDRKRPNSSKYVNHPGSVNVFQVGERRSIDNNIMMAENFSDHYSPDYFGSEESRNLRQQGNSSHVSETACQTNSVSGRKCASA